MFTRRTHVLTEYSRPDIYSLCLTYYIKRDYEGTSICLVLAKKKSTKTPTHSIIVHLILVLEQL